MPAQTHMGLHEAMQIRGPHALEDAPNAYSFSRKRDISADESFWEDVLENIGITPAELDVRRRAQLKRYFEILWALPAAGQDRIDTINANIFALTAEWPAFIHNPDTVYKTTDGPLVDGTFYLYDVSPTEYRVPPYATAAVDVLDGCVLRVPLDSGQARWFQPMVSQGPNDQRPARRDELAGEVWDTAWDNITELVSLYYAPLPDGADQAAKDALQNGTKALAANGFSAVDVIRADAALIEQQYQQIESDYKLATQLAFKADQLLNDAITTAPPSMMAALINHYRELNSHLPRIERLRYQLADAASDLGYRLFLEKTSVVYTDINGADQTVEIDPGKLFQESQRTVSWVTYQTVTHTSRSLFRKRTHTHSIPTEHTKTFTYYERAQVDHDPWVEIAEAYRKRSFNVFLFRETAGGLATADGSSIESVIARCRTDEEFRIRCAVGIPFYENTIIGERMLVGYALLVRPLPEIAASLFPSILIDEKLTYKFAWQGVALGELAATIPLAPGEERTVSIAVSQRFEASRSVTTTSLSEITRVDKSDFETVFEKEVRREKESTTSAGGSVGGSYGPVSGSANFSTTTTTKDMSRQLNRSVQRASQELTRRSKEETTVVVTEKSEAMTSSTTSYKIKNINEGRTLNINMYRLINTYRSNLFLNDFDFFVQAGPEVVMGTGLRGGRSFSRTNIDRLWSYLLEEGVMPIDLSDRSDAFKVALCAEISERMEEEYSDDDAEHPDEGEAGEGHDIFGVEVDGASSFTVPQLVEGLRQQIDVPISFVPRALARLRAEDPEGFEASSGRALEALSRSFSTEKCEFSGLLNRPFRDTHFSYDSGGLHADAQVGLQPATEEYSEKMRTLEARAKQAEQELVSARANYLNAKAIKALVGFGDVVDPDKIFVTDRAVLYESDGHVSVSLRLSHSVLPADGWLIHIENGGRYPQESHDALATLRFRLPRLYQSAPWDIGNKGHAWYASNVLVVHPGLNLTLRYSAPT